MKWIKKATGISGNASRLAWELWHLSGLHKSKTFKLSNGNCEEVSITRQAKYEILKQMEDAGLIKVKRRNGASPVVTILDVD